MAQPKVGTSKASAAMKRELFVEAYITNGGNASKAAISAGYSVKTAGAIGYDLLKHPETKALLAERQSELATKFKLTTESVLGELAKIVHSDPRKFFDEFGKMKHPSEWDEGMAGAVASMDVSEDYESGPDGRKAVGETKKVKFWDKNSAIEKAMKHLGLFERDNEQTKPDPIEGVTDVEIARRVAFILRRGVEKKG